MTSISMTTALAGVLILGFATASAAIPPTSASPKNPAMTSAEMNRRLQAQMRMQPEFDRRRRLEARDALLKNIDRDQAQLSDSQVPEFKKAEIRRHLSRDRATLAEVERQLETLSKPAETKKAPSPKPSSSK